MELKSLLKEIKSLKKKAAGAPARKNKDGKELPPNPGTIQTHKARQRAAELRLPDVTKDYRKALLSHIIPVLVTGSSAEDFVKVASEALGVISVDGEALFKTLASKMPTEASSGKMTTKVVVDILGRHFNDIAIDSDVIEYPQIIYKNSKGFVITKKSDLDRLIKKIITEQVGAEMSTIYNLKDISDKALEMEFDGGKLPVLMSVSDASVIDSIFESQKRLSLTPYLLTSGEVKGRLNTKALDSVEEVSKESVSKALKTVKNSLKRSKK